LKPGDAVVLRPTKPYPKHRIFAKRWSVISVLLASLAYFGYRYIADHVAAVAGATLYYSYSVPTIYGPALMFLVAIFIVEKRILFHELSFVGNFSKRDLALGLAAVTCLYTAVYLAADYLGNPREPSMVLLYSFKSTFQITILVLTLLILPPIVEELLYRHFILTSVPVFKGKVTAACSILITSALFSYAHNYVYQLTYISLFLVGIILGIARVHSKGLLLPILLHMYAIGYVLLCDQVVKHMEVANQIGG
jgi:membrane protease YdiL (CAAX protease family)